MKRIISDICVGLAIAITLTSCAKDEGYDNYQGYNVGKQSYDYMENNMAAMMSSFDLLLRMNAFLQISDEQKTEAEAYYFPEYQLTPIDENEWVGLKDQDTVFKIIKDDLTLTTETSCWKIFSCSKKSSGIVSVVCSGPRNWQLEVKAMGNQMWVSDAHLKIQYNGEEKPESFNQSDWNISGSGRSIADDNESTIIGFEVTESLGRFADSRYLFDKGVVYLKVKKENAEAEEVIKADLKPSSDNKRNLQITYKGEIFSYNEK